MAQIYANEDVLLALVNQDFDVSNVKIFDSKQVPLLARIPLNATGMRNLNNTIRKRARICSIKKRRYDVNEDNIQDKVSEILSNVNKEVNKEFLGKLLTKILSLKISFDDSKSHFDWNLYILTPRPHKMYDFLMINLEPFLTENAWNLWFVTWGLNTVRVNLAKYMFRTL